MRLTTIIIWSPMTEALSRRNPTVETKLRPLRLIRRRRISGNRNASRANGVPEMGLGSGVCGTTQWICRRGRLSKSTFLLVWSTERWDYSAQYLRQGPAQRFVSLLGYLAWVFQARGTNFPSFFLGLLI